MEKNNYSGKFIVLEGLDGSGQSTQVSLLKDFLREKSFRVLVTKEPTFESEAGKKIREILDEKIKIEPVELQKLFAQDRKEHLENLIVPALKEGKIVISDRYFFSSFAYGASEELSLEYLIGLNNDFLLPDLTVILKVKPEICLSRIESRGEPKTLFEKQEKLAKVWETYKIMPDKFENVEIIDGEKSIEDVFKEIQRISGFKIAGLPAEPRKPQNFSKRRIYALPNDLMPEVKAVTFAKCSRTPEPFDEIAAELTQEKSSRFHEKWVVGFGHSSIAEHAVISMAIENVSILATKVIEDSRLASYTEKSTRYQIFNRERLYKPENIMNSELKNTYEDIINLLMDTYQEISQTMIDFIKKEHPRREEESPKLYEMISKSKACDNIRYLLPIATLTNLGMTINARELEHLIKKLLSHPLKEMRDIGQEMKEKAVRAVPTLIRRAEKSSYIKETKEKLSQISQEELNKPSKADEPVKIVDYPAAAEDKLIVSLLYPYARLSYKEIKDKIKEMSKEKKEKIIDEALKRRDKFDAPLRELEHLYYTFDILMDYGAFRDVQRHRICTQANQEATVVHGYDMPPDIAKAGLENKFRQAADSAVEAYQKIYPRFPKEAQYLIPLCFRKRLLITWNLRELHHFISLRSGKKGHPSYRRIAQECWRQLNNIQPLLARYIRVDMDEEGSSWAASLENKEFYYNPWAARQNKDL